MKYYDWNSFFPDYKESRLHVLFLQNVKYSRCDSIARPAANADNCFSGEIRRLIAECDNVNEGYVYSKDLRRLQIAIADSIINVKLY